MFKKYNILLSILSFFLCSCSANTSTAHSACDIIDPPTKSFVKIIQTIEIVSCTDPKDKLCPIGKRMSSGSGMAVKLDSNNMTVLTAGHVCEVGVTKAIKDYNQSIEVIDHNSVLARPGE